MESVVRCMPLTPKVTFLLLFWLLFVAAPLLFAQNVEPLPPISPQTIEECTRLQEKWQQRIQWLTKQNQDCSTFVSERCRRGANGDGSREAACLQREQCHNCWPEHTLCGDLYYQFKACQSSESDLVCAVKRGQLANQKCQEQVNDYIKHHRNN
jgi:hypothetical protein